MIKQWEDVLVIVTNSKNMHVLSTNHFSTECKCRQDKCVCTTYFLYIILQALLPNIPTKAATERDFVLKPFATWSISEGEHMFLIQSAVLCNWMNSNLNWGSALGPQVPYNLAVNRFGFLALPILKSSCIFALYWQDSGALWVPALNSVSVSWFQPGFVSWSPLRRKLP